ncbi:MAG: hypothetical protein ACE5HN_10650, partial [Nitrospiria bacterium]
SYHSGGRQALQLSGERPMKRAGRDSFKETEHAILAGYLILLFVRHRVTLFIEQTTLSWKTI